MADRILVLAVDIDNDLYRKAKITGPVVGRNDNLKAAARLALADPQDTDSNAMFEAVRKYDELKKAGHRVLVVTITGAEKEGYVADSELARQLDIVLEKFKADSCVLVTDGASDIRILPVLKSRVKVNSVDIVRMKQAPQFESAYFTILEKLKEPHYARIVFGIPAILLLLFAVSYYFNYGWQPPVALIGLYLILKGFGLEESIVNSFRGFGFSIYRMSFVFFMAAVVFFIIAVVIGYGSYTNAVQNSLTTDPLALAAYGLEGFLLILPISMILFLIGRVTDLESRRMRYRAIAQGTYVGFGIAAVVLLYLAAAWVIGQIYFSDLLFFSAVVLVGGYLISKLSISLRSRAVKRTRMKDKQVINDIGAYIGKITEIDLRRGVMLVKTDYGNVLKYDIDRITNISDRVIIR
jgi:putative membrane protein